MKQLYSLIFLVLISMLNACVSDPNMDTSLKNAKAPAISAPEKTEQTASTITLSATVSSENGSAVSERGFCWSTKSDDAPATNISTGKYKKDSGSGSGNFTVKLSDLNDNTTYYVYAYATNEVGTTFSEARAFSTNKGIGSVATLSAIDIHATTVILSGFIPANDRGEGAISVRGFYISPTNHDPTASDSTVFCTLNASLDVAVNDTFDCRVTGLKPLTTYYYRAFAKNNFGIFPSAVDSFSTTSGKPTMGKFDVENIGYSDATFSAILDSPGDANIKSVGFTCGTENNPTIDNADKIVCVLSNNAFSGKISNLKSQQKYFVRAYATNSFGTTYSDSCYYFYTKTEYPTVSTNEISSSNVSNGEALVGGKIINKGMTDVLRAGIIWSTTEESPTLENGNVVDYPLDQLVESGDFLVKLISLTGGTTYYIRAFATNSSTTPGYGNVQKYTMPSIFTSKNIYPGANRIFSTGFALSGLIYVIGGDLGSTCTDEMLGYNVENNEWAQLTPYVHAYSQMASCTRGTVAFVMGGTDKKEMGTTLELYSPSSNIWNSLPVLEGNNIRRDAVCFNYNDSIYLVGGINSSGNYTGEVWRYYHSEWRQLSSNFPAQHHGIALVVNDTIYAGLGETSNLSNNLLMSIGNPEIWKTAPGSLPGTLGSISSGIYYNSNNRHSLILINEEGIIWEYNLSKFTWSQKASFPTRMKNYLMYELNGIIYILGQDLYTPGKFMVYNLAWDN